MEIKQFYDKALSQLSYAIESQGQIALVDPARDIQPYLDFAKQYGGEIVAVLETHPHADFASSHLEISKRFNVPVYINSKAGVYYDANELGHNEEVQIGDLTFRALFTPGHSPDHNAYLLLEYGVEKAVFSGDALFVGDVGRPDLREGTGNMQVSKKELAGMMYDTINKVFSKLDDDTIVYPAHGPGSLCGKNMGKELQTTIGKERSNNWAFQIKDKDQFITDFLDGQAFIPKYFPYEVEVNRKGIDSPEEDIQKIYEAKTIDEKALIIDVRDQEKFKKGHIKQSINIQLGDDTSKFETWLGSIVGPDESFNLVAEDRAMLEKAVRRTAKIAYEGHITGMTYQLQQYDLYADQQIDLQDFKQNPDDYTILDIRNEPEVADGKIFEKAIHVPLPELRERITEIPDHRPVVVHCAGGYRSAAGSSILATEFADVAVYDLSKAISDFK
ncbi:MBL fold metallo-hydrolase [Marivirga lumbricoides]|uniref:MBL fold metallo-hydrolase n=1 Tax=Marivirga lumbricoides TaxID=1046115 RepID=A0A2T4DPW1_9BACT|nr:MBL fold metallo-hydrolase [Marivirga lumbricoides]GGC56365.1 MBL fold metallo-hydrolase [Marivirga lumbricoides]